MKKITITVDVEEHVTEEDLRESLKEKNKTASFKSRKRIAWISFFSILVTLFSNYFVQFKNENLIEIIVIGLFSVILGYIGTVSNEFIKMRK